MHLFLLLAVTASPSFGRSVIVGNNAPKAKAAALENAVRAAVESAVQQLEGPPPGEDATVDQQVYETPRAFAKSVTVVRESVEDNVLMVEANVAIDEAALKAALGARRHKTTPKKSVLILASEQIGPQKLLAWTDIVYSRDLAATSLTAKSHVATVQNEFGAFENVISDVFSASGFKVIDLHVLKGEAPPAKGLAVKEIGTDDLAKLGLKASADYVVVIRGTTKTGYHSMLSQAGVNSGQANATGRLVRTADAKVVSSASTHGASVHIDAETAQINALNDAARAAASELVEKAALP
jgi:hypothetical protein